MTAPVQNTLEHKGNFATHPLAELLVELTHARLTGSMRMSDGDKKTVVYFADGELVYAVANSKALRLFNLLLRKGKIDAKTISKYPNFANDLEFASKLIGDGLFAKGQIDEVAAEQVEAIVIDALSWPSGEWVFSPLVRVKQELWFPVDVHRVLMDYGRCIADQVISHRFMSVSEKFTAVENKELIAQLQPNEAFVYYRFLAGPLTIAQLRELSSGQEQGVLQALYVLWLGGLLERGEWNAAFSDNRLNHIRRTSVSKVKDASDVAESVKSQPEAVPVADIGKTESEPEKLPVNELTLQQYLDRVEKGDTHYDTLGIDPKGDMSNVKALYFSLAKQFHPDRHHRESPETIKRVQTAFTALLQAYEILKSPESREAYNAKMYKEIEAREKRREAGIADADPADRNAESGLDNFEEGLSLLNDDEPEAATVYLARAVHYSPQNALYHAYYGVALSSDPKQRHKAESELQAGVKLDPKNPKIRMMLVEFLVDNNMLKRAEGELRRFLEVAPGNKEATAMLNKIVPPST